MVASRDVYASRRTSIGSTRAARRAGNQHASRATPTSTAGSQGTGANRGAHDPRTGWVRATAGRPTPMNAPPMTIDGRRALPVRTGARRAASRCPFPEKGNSKASGSTPSTVCGSSFRTTGAPTTSGSDPNRLVQARWHSRTSRWARSTASVSVKSRPGAASSAAAERGTGSPPLRTASTLQAHSMPVSIDESPRKRRPLQGDGQSVDRNTPAAMRFAIRSPPRRANHLCRLVSGSLSAK